MMSFLPKSRKARTRLLLDALREIVRRVSLVRVPKSVEPEARPEVPSMAQPPPSAVERPVAIAV